MLQFSMLKTRTSNPLRVVGIRDLQAATDTVVAELDTMGFYDERLDEVEVYLVPVGVAFGWQLYGGDRSIKIPMLSLSRLLEHFGWDYSDLSDVLRHEYGHAVADTHRGLMRSRRFSGVFGGSHESIWAQDYDPEHHVTQYAATNPSEDFAELFYLYLKHAGRLPGRYSTVSIRAKWHFIRDLRRAIQQGRRRW